MLLNYHGWKPLLQKWIPDGPVLEYINRGYIRERQGGWHTPRKRSIQYLKLASKKLRKSIPEALKKDLGLGSY